MTLHTELPIPGLRNGGGPPDVEVILGRSAVPLDRAHGSRWMRDGVAGLRVPGVLTAIVSGGRRIEVWPAATAVRSLCIPIVSGPLLAAVLVQRGLLVLHGTVVAKDGRGLLIVGATSTGKSEAAWGLLQEGWQLVSDDLAALEYDRGRLTARTGRSVLDLWPDSLRRWGAVASIDQTAHSGKVSVDVAAVGELRVPIDALVLLVVHNGDVSVQRPASVATFNELLRARCWRRGGAGMDESRVLSTQAALVNSCRVSAIRYARAPGAAYHVVDAIRECAGW